MTVFLLNPPCPSPAPVQPPPSNHEAKGSSKPAGPLGAPGLGFWPPSHLIARQREVLEGPQVPEIEKVRQEALPGQGAECEVRGQISCATVSPPAELGPRKGKQVSSGHGKDGRIPGEGSTPEAPGR